MTLEIKYYNVVENGETKHLKTKASSIVMNFMLQAYKTFYSSLKKKEDCSFQKFLITHGIECIYDGTFGYIDVDAVLKDIS